MATLTGAVIVNKRFHNHGNKFVFNFFLLYRATTLNTPSWSTEILRRMNATNVKIGNSIVPDIMYV